jgi:hypothetical protein
MGTLLKVKDEFFGKSAETDRPAVELRLASERISPREIIRQRVFAEVAELNETRMKHARDHARTRSFLIEVPDDSPEARLNRALPNVRRKARLIDAEEEFGKALDAFARNRFVMLFDDRQVDGLEDELIVTPQSEVVFLHLTPLRGG